jgi:LuxR family quorum sensing-dependent transcriptional regulator
LEALDAAPNMDALCSQTMSAIGDFGLTVAASGIIAGSKAAAANRFHFANWPPQYLDRYVSEELQAVDPIPRWARGTGEPASYSHIIACLGAKDPGIRAIELGAEYGITQGICIPMRGADGTLGVVAFAAKRPDFEPAEFRALVSIGTIVFRTAERIDRSNHRARAAPILTSREIQLLPLLVHGHCDREIAQMVAISEATVRFHLKNVRDKIGAVSRTHLAAKVVALGFVSL